MNLVTNRTKLQPFLSEGFSYKDRKHRVDERDFMKVVANRAMKARVEKRMRVMRLSIKESILNKNFGELERIYTQLTSYEPQDVET